MPNIAVQDHPWIGVARIFREDLPPYDPAEDDEPGTLVVGNGMPVGIRAVFRDWDDVPGLTILWVYCPTTGESTHVTPADLGLTERATIEVLDESGYGSGMGV